MIKRTAIIRPRRPPHACLLAFRDNFPLSEQSCNFVVKNSRLHGININWRTFSLYNSTRLSQLKTHIPKWFVRFSVLIPAFGHAFLYIFSQDIWANEEQG